MNRRLCVRVGLISHIFLCAALVDRTNGQAVPGVGTSGIAPPAAPAPVTAGPSIPPGAETAPDAAPFTSTIRTFIQNQLTAIGGSDYTAQTAAREALRKTLTRGSSPSYYAVFCKEWTTACTTVITKTPPPVPGVRLNIAIVTSTLTDNGQTMERSALSSAESLVDLLLGDSSPSVSLWGIRAARPLVQLEMQLPNVGSKSAITASPLVGSLVSAVRKHSATDIAGFLTQDAYTALAVQEIPGMSADKLKPLQPPLVDPILDILDSRVKLYKDGPIPSPGAERQIATFLSTQYASPSLSPTTQRRMVQLLVNLENNAGQRADQYINDRTALAQLREMLKYTASALKVIANDKSVDTSLSWLSAIPPASTPPDIYTHTKQVAGVMKNVFTWVILPPEIPVMDPPALIKPAAAPGIPPAAGGAPAGVPTR